jgi:integrase
MASQNLTAAAIEAFCYDPEGPSRQVFWDRKVAGLGVRVTPANGKQYVLHYRRHGRARLMSLGLVRDFRNVSDARDEALEYLRRLRRDDVDPLVERARQKAAGSCSELFARWLVYVATKRKASTHAEYKRHVDSHLDPEFANHRPQDVTRPEVRKLHARISASNGAYMANSVLRSLRAAINWAKRQDDGTLPANHPNPVVGVEFNREKARDEHLRASELPAVAAAVQQEADIWVRAFFWLLLLTSARKNELLQLCWSQVRLELGEIVFRDTKNGEDFTIRLSEAAIAILRQIPRVAGCEYVFPNRRSDGRRGFMSGPRVAWKAVLTRAGVGRRVTLHDVRRSVGTALARAGYTAEQIAGLLNHKSNVTAKHYVRLASDTQQQMATELAAITAAAPAANSDAAPNDESTAA